MEKYLLMVGRTNTGYSAYSPDIPGCIATGATIEETIKKMKSAIAFHFEGMVEDGDPIPKPRGLDAFRDIIDDSDSEQYLMAHVAIDVGRFETRANAN